jgi:hypothetical protein
MANQSIEPQPGDVADEKGRFAPIEQPGDEAMAPDIGIDEVGIHESISDTPPTRRTGTQGAVIEDLADPDADVNFPDPSSPISMSTGPRSQPDRGRDIPGGGYGDSRDTEAGDRAISDEEAGPGPGAEDEDEVRSGSHLTEDDTKGTPAGSHSEAEHPRVSQPANVNEPRRP